MADLDDPVDKNCVTNLVDDAVVTNMESVSRFKPYKFIDRAGDTV